MTRFKTEDVLSVTTGILMGEIGGVYAVMNFLADRSLYTHELVVYGKAAKAVLLAARPDIPGEATGETWQAVLGSAIAQLGSAVDLDDALRGVIAVDRSPIEALQALGVPADCISVVVRNEE